MKTRSKFATAAVAAASLAAVGAAVAGPATAATTSATHPRFAVHQVHSGNKPDPSGTSKDWQSQDSRHSSDHRPDMSSKHDNSKDGYQGDRRDSARDHRGDKSPEGAWSRDRGHEALRDR